MAQITITFDSDREHDEAMAAMNVHKVLQCIWNYQQALKDTEKHDCGPIMDIYKAEMRTDPESSPEYQMLHACREYLYQCLEPVSEVVND